jgi:hypothetical protein
MTKNRALKRAARERAQVTGESYVVALRNTQGGLDLPGATPTTAIGRTLHRWTHLVPGVPQHPDAATMAARHGRSLQSAQPRPAGRSGPSRKAHPVRDKRVLRRWQELIESRLLGR